MAQETLNGIEKTIETIGIYASIKNNSDTTIYVSTVPGIDPSSINSTPVQPGESLCMPTNREKKFYVLGTGDIAFLSSNEAFNFFKPAPKVGGGTSSEGITQQQLNDTLKLYATKETLIQGLDKKVDSVEGMGLSSNNYTDFDKQMLSGLNEDVITLQQQMPTSVNGDFTGSIEDGAITINFRKVKMVALPYANAWQKIAGIELARESGSTAGAVLLADRIYPETYDNHRENSLLNIGLRVYGDLTLHLDLSWNMVGSTVNLSDFVLAYKEDGDKFLVDFWVRGHTVWVYDVFVFLSEFFVNSNGWELYTPTSTNYSENLPEGYSVHESILAPTQANIPAIDKKIADLQKQIDNLRQSPI